MICQAIDSRRLDAQENFVRRAAPEAKHRRVGQVGKVHIDARTQRKSAPSLHTITDDDAANCEWTVAKANLVTDLDAKPVEQLWLDQGAVACQQPMRVRLASGQFEGAVKRKG